MRKHRRPQYTQADIYRKFVDDLRNFAERQNTRKPSGSRSRDAIDYSRSQPAGQNGDSYSPGLDSKGKIV